MDLDEKIKAGREYRRMTVAVDEAQDYKVRGYATTFGKRYQIYSSGDVIFDEEVDSRAFDGADLSDVIFQYDHVGRVFARTANNTLSLTPDSHGLKVEAYLGGTEIGKQLYGEIKGGYTDKMSFGFRVKNDEITEENRDGKHYYHRKITAFEKVFDVSAVSIPANDGTEISARSLSDGVIAKAEAERLLEAEKRKSIEELKTKIDKLLKGEKK